MAELRIPPLVRQRAEANEAGAQWLASLPQLVDEVARRWQLTLGPPYTGGTAGLVIAAVQLEPGGKARECVVKLPLLLDMHEVAAVEHAITAHRLADGRGCAALLDVDADTPALLLERLGPNLHDHDPALSVDAVLDAIASTLTNFWRPVEPDTDLMSGPDKARWLARYIESTWRDLGEPLSRPTIELALAYCGARADAHVDEESVLCHGDAHGWNTLSISDTSGRARYKFVDPEGFIAEPAADLGVPMREYNEPLLDGQSPADTARLVRQRAERLASRCDVDPEAVWQWGHMERVSTGLANLKDFGADDAAPFLEVAERCSLSRR